jgi:hypothetical protein
MRDAYNCGLTLRRLLENADNWYGLRVKPKQEQAVLWALFESRMEAFLPACQVSPGLMPKSSRVWSPLFPGCVLARLKPEQRLFALTIPGVAGFVPGQPKGAPIEPADIAMIRAIMSAGVVAVPWTESAIGVPSRTLDSRLETIVGLLREARRCRGEEGPEAFAVLHISSMRRAVAVEVQARLLDELLAAGEPKGESLRTMAAC